MATVRDYLGDDEEQRRLNGGEAQPAANLGGGPSGGGVSGSGAQPDYTRSNFVSGKTILAKNKGAAAPNLTGDLQARGQQNIADIGQGISKYIGDVNSEANKFSYGNNYVSKAAKGDADSANAIKQITGYDANTNIREASQGKDLVGNRIDIQDINALNSGAGVQSALQRQQQSTGNFGYNQGQAALDSAIYGRSPGARQQIGDLLSQREQINQQSQAAADQAKQARQSAIGNVNNLKTRVTGDLQNYSGSLEKAANARTQALNKSIYGGDADAAARAKYSTVLKRMIDDQLAKVSDSRARGFAQDAIDKQNRSDGLLDVGSFLEAQKLAGPQYSTQDALQQNRILELLGSNSRVDEGLNNPEIGFNQEAVQAAIDKIISKANSKAEKLNIADQQAADEAAAEARRREAERKGKPYETYRTDPTIKAPPLAKAAQAGGKLMKKLGVKK